MNQDIILGRATEIPVGEGRTFSVKGRPIAVFRTRGGGLYATQADCPHLQGPLADGLVGERSVVCPLHDRRFDLGTGHSDDGSCSLRVYPVSEDRDGLLVVNVGD